MQSLSTQRLTANAYRTLGLSGSAKQAEIDAAARRLRIWPDPARIPPTSWDLPALGPVARSRSDVEQALARLRQPATRLQERLCWYAGSNPPDAAVNGAKSGDRSIVDLHDAAVAALHQAWAGDPDGTDVPLWESAMRSLAGLAASADYVDWVAAGESGGGFDVRASGAELTAAAKGMPAALAGSLAPLADAAFWRGDEQACAGLLGVIRLAGPEAAQAEADFLDRAEDRLAGQCEELDGRFRPRLGTTHDDPGPFYAANREASMEAETDYRTEIEPLLKLFVSLLEGNRGSEEPGVDRNDRRNAGRLARASSRCAQLLSLIALGWEWAGQFVKAEQILKEALELAEGTSTSATILRELERVSPKARQEEERSTWTASTRAPATLRYSEAGGNGIDTRISTTRSTAPRKVAEGGGNKRWLHWAVILAGSGVLHTLIIMVAHDSTPEPSVPNFNNEGTEKSIRDLFNDPELKDLGTGPPTLPIVADPLVATPDRAQSGDSAPPGATIDPSGPPLRPPDTQERTFGGTNREP